MGVYRQEISVFVLGNFHHAAASAAASEEGELTDLWALLPPDLVVPKLKTKVGSRGD